MFNALVKYSNEVVVLYTKNDISILFNNKVDNLHPSSGSYYAWSIDKELINVPTSISFYTNHKELTLLDEFNDGFSSVFYKVLDLIDYNSGDDNNIIIRTPRAVNFGTNYYLFPYSLNYQIAEIFLDSLPDWTGDSSTHEVRLQFKYDLQGNEKLMNLIQRTTDKGWTVYEEYN